ncbi:MAG: CHAT domain-containing protein [Methanobacteriaceae archaeon]|jgi:CHAT domain-containing protein|nr:CHAT domain-containing protein [Candidatus Methanofastidiosa archaeon]NYB26065.1 CHAT domain-containing protein [Methanobacteriaceae archaeon]
MTNKDILKSAIINILRNYPHILRVNPYIFNNYPTYYLETDFKILFSYNESIKISKCLLYQDVEELSVNDFEEIERNGDFLNECGILTLKYGIDTGKHDFLRLSKDINYRCRSYYLTGTKNYGIVVSNEAQAVNQLSEFGNKENELNLAIKLYYEALKNGIEKNSLDEGIALMGIAICRKKLAELGISPIDNLLKGISSFEKAKRIPALRSSKENYYRTLANEANSKRLLAEYGYYPLKYLKESISLFKKANFDEKFNQALSFLNEGLATQTLAEYTCDKCKEDILKDSIKLFQNAQERFVPYTINHAKALTNEGISNFELSKISSNPDKYLNEALKCHKKAIKKGNFKIRNHTYMKIVFNKATTELLISELKKDHKILDNALSTYSKLEKYFKKIGGTRILIDMYRNMGRALYIFNEKKEAYSYLKKSINIIEEIRASMAILNRKYFFETISETYKLMVLTCIDLNYNEEAFKYAESAKNRTILELLYNKNIKKTSINKLESDSLISLNDLSKIIKNKTIVEYFLAEKLIVFIFNNEKLTVKTININQNDIKLKVTEFRNKINEINDIINKYNDGIIDEVAYKNERERKCNDLEEIFKELYFILIKPIKEHLNEEIIIIPHDYLHYIPFQALKNDKYLVQDHRISMAQSASLLKYLKPGEGSGSLVVGNPNKGHPKYDLTFAEDEAKKVAKKLAATLLIGNKATKDSVLNEIKDKGIVHFACHGFFNDYDPINSGLKLSDQFLTAVDFMNLKLSLELTVLSACDTALGDLNNTDELEGLVRSIQYSGCRFVIASLWQVEDDSTKDLFLEFYNSTGSNLTKLNNAQNTLISSFDIYSWAPFQIYGI